MRARSTAWHCRLWGDRCCPTCASSSAGGGGLGGDSVRDGVLPDLLALSEVVDLPVIVPRQVAALAELHGGSSDSVLRRLGSCWLVVQTVLKTVWRSVVVRRP